MYVCDVLNYVPYNYILMNGYVLLNIALVLFYNYCLYKDEAIIMIKTLILLVKQCLF